MAGNVIREANEDRKTEHYRNKRARVKPVKKDTQGLLNSAITLLSINMSHLAYL